jgi:hypothetical protein
MKGEGGGSKIFRNYTAEKIKFSIRGVGTGGRGYSSSRLEPVGSMIF